MSKTLSGHLCGASSKATDGTKYTGLFFCVLVLYKIAGLKSTYGGAPV